MDTPEERYSICKGPLHRGAKILPADSFAPRSRWCRACMRDYDQRRGRTRGTPRSVAREQKQNNQPPMLTTTMKNGELGLKGKGVERISIEEIDKLVDLYVMARDKRMSLTEKEVEAKTKLIDSLHKHKDKIGVKKEMINGVESEVITYHHDDLIVTLKHGKDDLKVKKEVEDDSNG